MKKIIYQTQLPLFNQFPWIKKYKNSPYFQDEMGNAWHPIGQNDAITWPALQGAFARRNLESVEHYFQKLRNNGVTCLRLMLEYCQTENRYFEKPVGNFQPNMVQLWDDIFRLCEKYELRIMLTPFDTYWMRRRWGYHPYKKSNGGPCTRGANWFLCSDTVPFIKNRLSFVIERWGGSGVLFAWDLWNEITPNRGKHGLNNIYNFISEISSFVRELEFKLYGKSHLQTVSVFSPTLDKHAGLGELVHTHPCLDFASAHFYDSNTINNPKNTIDPAIKTKVLVREALSLIKDARPFLDTEHGPIDAFKRRRILKIEFDEVYFNRMQWAHLASGGAGGGMRWPYRHPHILTDGMLKAQQRLVDFMKYINWETFGRKSVQEEVYSSSASFILFSCGDDNQKILWLLKKDTPKSQTSEPPSSEIRIHFSPLTPGTFSILGYDTWTSLTVFTSNSTISDNLSIDIPDTVLDLAVYIKRLL